MSEEEMTYSKAGVDIKKEGRTVSRIVREITFRREGFGGAVEEAGHFAGLIDFGDYFLAMTTDGVGSKMILAEELGKYDTVGIDCIAMNVNDLVAIGAEPIAFVDYLAVEKHDEEIASHIGRGLNRGAEMANVSIVGGETATLPDMVRGIDLSGAALGYLKKEDLVDGRDIRDGDHLYSLPSTGPHSNGYTLIRKLLKRWEIDPRERILKALERNPDLKAALKDNLEEGDYRRALQLGEERRGIGELLLEPTAIYVKPVLRILRERRVHGIAHITGGGVTNLLRLKEGMDFIIDRPPEPSPLFLFLKGLGNISWWEMYRTFNMGMGMILVTPPGELDSTPGVRRIGRVSRGEGKVTIPPLKLHFEEYF